MYGFNKEFKEVLAALENQDYQKATYIFEYIQPYDRARILMEISAFQRKELSAYLSEEELAEIFQELEYEYQHVLMENLSTERLAKIISEMPNDDAVDLLGELDEGKKQELLRLIDHEEAVEIKGLLNYPEYTAGGIMTTEYVVIPQEYTAAETINSLRDNNPEAETVYYLYVVNQAEKLIGVLSLRDLIVANPDTKISEIMFERVVSVSVDMDQEEVAKIMEKYDFLAIPVVDYDKKLVGIVTFDDAMDVLKDEATEDIARLGGIGGKDSKVHDLKVGVLPTARKRIPWLVLLLGVGIMSGNIIAQFEETLEAVVILAIFIPMIADMAGNTGTQSLAVVVRGLAIGEFTTRDAFHLIKREAGVGIIIGVVNGILISIFVGIWQNNFFLGLVIGLSLSSTLFFATLAGTIVPLIMAKLKVDPAIASGPFITTVNDILGLTIYFTIATRFMAYL